jgi:hypothetical protein
VRLALLAVFTLVTLRASASEVTDNLETLRKKLAAKEAERTQQSPGGSPTSQQIKMIQGLIARADYDKAQQLLGNVSNYGLPPEFQEEWMQVVDALGKDLEKLQAESMEKWRSEVDLLVADSKKGCLDAKNSADLDPLLIRCAALQMRREQQNNILGERTYRKLTGTASTLSSWANYLDFRDAGNIRRANETLRSLMTNESIFPVLTVQEIDARFLVDGAETLNSRSALAKVFEGVKSADDLPAALERLKVYSSSPMNPELSALRNEQKRMEAVQQAWEMVKKGDDSTALKTLDRMNSFGGMEEAQSYYEPLKRQIFRKALQSKAQAWSKLSQNSDEDAPAFLDRILDELQGRQDYAAIIEVMKFSEQINRTGQAGTSAQDRTALENFLAAQRFENAGDDLAAVTNYRLVVGAPSGKYVPTARAEEALKKLKEKNPEVFKNYEGALMEEMRSMRQQIQMLLGRTSGARPYPPFPGR